MSESPEKYDISDADNGSDKGSKSATKKLPSKKALAVLLGVILVGGGSFVAYKAAMNQANSQQVQVSDHVESLRAEIKAEFAKQQRLNDTLRSAIETNNNLIDSEAKRLKESILKDIESSIDKAIQDNNIHIGETNEKIISEFKSNFIASQKDWVNSSINSKLTPFKSFNDVQVVTNQKIFELIDGLEAKIDSKSIAKVEKDKRTRTRLKEFNTAVKVTDGVYSVQAPFHGESKNWITLWEGERFFSKVGRHKVTGIETDGDGNVKLLIDDKYFIDEKREEYTPSELLAFKKSKKTKSSSKSVNKSKSTSAGPSATQVAATSTQNIGKTKAEKPAPVAMTTPHPKRDPRPDNRSPETASAHVQESSSLSYKNGRVLLPNWATITQEADLKSALVVDMASVDRRPIKVEINKNYDFIGTVTKITPNGTVCSDTRCIGAIE